MGMDGLYDTYDASDSDNGFRDREIATVELENALWLTQQHATYISIRVIASIIQGALGREQSQLLATIIHEEGIKENKESKPEEKGISLTEKAHKKTKTATKPNICGKPKII